MTKWISTRKKSPEHGETIAFRLQSILLEKPKRKIAKTEQLKFYKIGMFDKTLERFVTAHLSYTIYRVTHWSPIEFVE